MREELGSMVGIFTLINAAQVRLSGLCDPMVAPFEEEDLATRDRMAPAGRQALLLPGLPLQDSTARI